MPSCRRGPPTTRAPARCPRRRRCGARECGRDRRPPGRRCEALPRSVSVPCHCPTRTAGGESAIRVPLHAAGPAGGIFASRSQGSEQLPEAFEREIAANAPATAPQDGSWKPGDAPSQALRWAVEALAGAVTLSIIGVYPPTMDAFPIGMAMNKNLTINMGNCNHRKYIPHLVELVRIGAV